MGRTFGWRSALLLFAAACSAERVTAPGVCPQFCAGVSITSRDTVLTTAVYGDSTYTGYVQPFTANELIITSGGTNSRAVLRFFRLLDTIQINLNDTSRRPVVATDSFRVMVVTGRRSRLTGLTLSLYRLPYTVDTTSTYTDVAPYFADSMFIRDFPVADSVTFDSLFISIPTTALAPVPGDSGRYALGIALKSPTPAYLALGAAEGFVGATLSRFVQVDSIPTVRAKRETVVSAALDTHIAPPTGAVPAGVLAIGGAPSARTFFRFNVPNAIIDSSNVVRATLLLIPAAPATGAPGDTLVLLPHGVSSDIGPKSPVQQAVVDSSGITGARVVPGSADTIKVDVTFLVQNWKSDSLPPVRTIMVRQSPEGSSFGQVRFWSTNDALRRPVLRVTYVPPLSYQGR